MFDRLKHIILCRYQSNWDKSLYQVYHLDPDVLTLDEYLVQNTWRYRDSFIDILDTVRENTHLIDFCVEHAEKFTYEKNQFIQILPEHREDLRHVYHMLLQQSKHLLKQAQSLSVLKTGFESLLIDHFSRLHRLLSATLHVDPDTESTHSLLQTPVCHEYSPDIQLSIMGIDLNELKEPVIDLGCGRSALLVHYLNTLGIKTFGMDRDVINSSFLMRADWMDFPAEKNRWGTILSHMAFSNHFMFQHHYRYGHPEHFAHLYMRLLNALQYGGSLYYSPGLPFIERFLPSDRYNVSVLPLSGSHMASFNMKHDPASRVSTHIKKI